VCTCFEPLGVFVNFRKFFLDWYPLNNLRKFTLKPTGLNPVHTCKFFLGVILSTEFKPVGVDIIFRRFLTPSQNFTCVHGIWVDGCECKISSISDRIQFSKTLSWHSLIGSFTHETVGVNIKFHNFPTGFSRNLE
jgi:hypothetical protein